MADPEKSNLSWYAIHVRTGQEEKVLEHLHERIKTNKMEDMFKDILVPEEEVVEMREGQKRKIRRKFFPGYVWLQMELNEKTWYLIKNVPGVINFIGGQNPAPIPEKEVNAIRERIKQGEGVEKPKVLFEPGEMVRVTAGPFADFNGVVEDVNYEKNRLRVSVLIFGRSTPVELEFGQVEKG